MNGDSSGHLGPSPRLSEGVHEPEIDKEREDEEGQFGFRKASFSAKAKLPSSSSSFSGPGRISPLKKSKKIKSLTASIRVVPPIGKLYSRRRFIEASSSLSASRKKQIVAECNPHLLEAKCADLQAHCNESRSAPSSSSSSLHKVSYSVLKIPNSRASILRSVHCQKKPQVEAKDKESIDEDSISVSSEDSVQPFTEADQSELTIDPIIPDLGKLFQTDLEDTAPASKDPKVSSSLLPGIPDHLKEVAIQCGFASSCESS